MGHRAARVIVFESTAVDGHQMLEFSVGGGGESVDVDGDAVKEVGLLELGGVGVKLFLEFGVFVGHVVAK